MPLDWQLNTMVTGLQGRPVSVAAPADGQVLSWNNTAEHWEPQNTKIVPPMVNYKGAVDNQTELPLVNQQTGDMYFVTSLDTFYMWNGTAWAPISPPINTLPFPEAPTDGLIYGRNGQSKTWATVVPITGGVTMTGGLVLNGPPVVGGNPNQAATMGFVDSQISDATSNILRQAVQFLGTLNAVSAVVVYTPQSGFTTGGLVPATQVPGCFVICSTAGTLPSGPLAGQQLSVGDWLISDGINWIPLRVAGSGGGGGGSINAVNVALNPMVDGWNNVQVAIQGIYSFLQTAPTGGAIISSTPPLGPTNGQLWWDDVAGELYVFYDDGTSSQWVLANTGTGSGGTSGPITGVTDGSNAAAGQVGEFVESIQNPNTPISAAQQLVVATLTLSAGDWDIWGDCRFIPAGGQPESIIQTWFSTNPVVTNTSQDPGNNTYVPALGNNVTAYESLRVSSNASFTVQLNIVAGAASGQVTLTYICARRMR